MTEVRRILAAGMHPILRVDPPTQPYIQEVERQLKGLSSQEQEKILINASSLPTKFRRSLYELADFYVYPRRFDAFLFLRELDICGLQLWDVSNN